MVDGVEQCLFLSAFTPTPNPQSQGSTPSLNLLPVVFHIHHGQLIYGFKVEHGEVKNVVKRGIIVGNANFRLGALGFLPHPDMEQVNVGQHDLLVALKWVQNYICSVGGNPSKV